MHAQTAPVTLIVYFSKLALQACTLSLSFVQVLFKQQVMLQNCHFVKKCMHAHTALVTLGA